MSDLRRHLHALGRFWKSALACLIVGVGLAGLMSARATPLYEVRATFFGSSQNALDTQAVQADEFAQRRINSYVGVVRSERVASLVKDVTGLDLSVRQIQNKLSASVAPDTVLLNVRVTDTDPDRAELIGKALTDHLDAEIAEIDNREGNASVVLNVISGPTLTPYAVSPNTKLNLAMGFVLGALIGVAQAVLRQQLDRTLRTREQLAEFGGYAVLGELPYDSDARSRPVMRESDQRSRRGEAFRHLRTNLRFLGAASPISVLVVSSSVEGEGKTTTATNLAMTLAAAGRKVLLVDADLRRPAVGRYLGIDPEIGLTNVLVDHTDPQKAIREWGPYGLSVLASGPLPPNPSELLGSQAMDWLVSKLRQNFEITIIDTPPLGSVTDAAVVAAKADGAILVVRSGRTGRERVQRALEAFENVDARVLGTVLTMARGRGVHDAYYGPPGER